MTPQAALPQALPMPLPFARACLDGWCRNDVVWLADVKRPPDDPARWRRATIIAVLPRRHLLVLRAEKPDAIIDLNPILHPHLLRRPTA